MWLFEFQILCQMWILIIDIKGDAIGHKYTCKCKVSLF